MTTPTTNLAASDIQTEFGGSNPIGLNEYYAGGSYVPSGTKNYVNVTVPSNSTISYDNLRGATAINYGSATANGYATDIALNEGQNVTFAWIPINVPNGTTVYWRLEAVTGNFNSSDISGGIITGSFTTDGSPSYSGTFTIANDATYDGSGVPTTEVFKMSVYKQSNYTEYLLSSPNVTIYDTSYPVPTISFTSPAEASSHLAHTAVTFNVSVGGTWTSTTWTPSTWGSPATGYYTGVSQYWYGGWNTSSSEYMAVYATNANGNSSTVTRNVTITLQPTSYLSLTNWSRVGGDSYGSTVTVSMVVTMGAAVPYDRRVYLRFWTGSAWAPTDWSLYVDLPANQASGTLSKVSTNAITYINGPFYVYYNVYGITDAYYIDTGLSNFWI